MIKNTLGKLNYDISKISLGTVQFGIDYGFTKKKTQEEVNKILECASKNGINLIDTAREYGDSENKIGDYISENTNDFIIATKLKKITLDKADDFNNLNEIIFKSIEESLKNLKLQKLDLLQLHQTNDYIIKNSNFWKVIEKLKKQKIINAFGVSVYDEEETDYIINNYNELVDFFQIPYNIFDRRFEKLQEKLKKHEISLISRSTYLKGIIPCSIEKIPKELIALKPFKIKLKEIAQTLSMNEVELSLLFVYYNNFVASTIIGINSVEELENNIDIINKHKKIKLNLEELNKLIIKDKFLIDPRQWTNF